MKELEYPFDNGFIMKKKRSLKRQLLGDGAVRLKKRVAVLGGSTTDDIVSVLEDSAAVKEETDQNAVLIFVRLLI